jgi:Flp pilus assembly protein TadD
MLKGKAKKFIYHLAKAHVDKPEDPEIMIYLSLGYDLVGQNDVARSLVEKCAKIDPINPKNDAVNGWNHFYGGRFDMALDPLFAACNLTPNGGEHQFWKALILLYNDRAHEAYEFICKSVKEPGTDT